MVPVLTRRTTRSLAGLVVAAGLLTAAGCSGDDAPDDAPGEQEETMTPDQARASLEEAATGLLTAAAPDGDAQLVPAQDVPCGGLGGNEFTQVKYTLEGIAAGATVADRDQALAAGRVHAEAAGLVFRDETNQRGDRVDQGYDGDGFVVVLQVYDNGAVTVSGETECLDNPEQ